MLSDFSGSISEIFLSLGGMSGLILLFKEIIRIYLKKSTQTFESVIEGEGKIYYHLAQIRDKTRIDKAVMLKLHNGGAEVRIGHMVYTTITHETHLPSMDSQINKWKRIRLDKVYTERIVNMLASDLKMGTTHTKDLEDSFFKDALIKNKIRKLEHVYVHTHKPKKTKFLTNFKEENISELWYLSLAYLEGNDAGDLTPRERDIIREHTRAIQNIIREGRKYD